MTTSEQSKKEINDALWLTNWATKINWDAHAKAQQERPVPGLNWLTDDQRCAMQCGESKEFWSN